MIDERTKQLYNLFFNLIENKLSYNSNEILNIPLIEYDCYRWYRFMSEADPNNAKGDTEEGKKDSAIAQTQLEQLNSERAKVFRVSPAINHLLNLTKPARVEQELKLPFDCLFIDSDIKIGEDIRIFGIYLQLITKETAKGLNDKSLKVVGKIFHPELGEFDYAQASCLFYAKEKGIFAFIDENINLNNGKRIKKVQELNGINNDDKYDKIIKSKLREYVLNLLLFLNEPRITIYIQEHNNRRREKKGLIPIPSLLRTRIEVGLENYIEKIYFNGFSHSKLGFSFWVRGHWMRFLHPRYVNMRGQKIWIAPHISGEGLMPPQIFEVSCSKDKQIQSTDKGKDSLKV